MPGRWSGEELRELDGEGRCVITDHGAFVLFNLYVPAITSEDPLVAEERFSYKMRFLEAGRFFSHPHFFLQASFVEDALL